MLNRLVYPGTLSLKYRKSAWCIVVGLLLFCALLIPRIEFENDLTRSFSSGGSHSDDYWKLISEMETGTTELVAVVTSSTPFSLKDYQRLRDMSFEFELTDNAAANIQEQHIVFQRCHDLGAN